MSDRQFPPEILDLIMRASWPGIRLGLTCRKLYEKLATDELVDQWVELIPTDTSHQQDLDVIHFELPNGVFHGHACVEGNRLQYSRGRVVIGWVESSFMNPHLSGNMVGIRYYRNMLVTNYYAYTVFTNGPVFINAAMHTLNYKGQGWPIPTYGNHPDDIKWFDDHFEIMCALAGEKFRHRVTTKRAKIPLKVSFAGVNEWPDCVRVG